MIPVFRELYQEFENKGKAKLLIELLSQQFGPVPEELQQRLFSLSSDRLSEIGQNILKLKNLRELRHRFLS